MPITLEIVASSVFSCQQAELGGAARVELCSALKTAGVTPSMGLIQAVKTAVNIPVFVMIRPREGDFIYSPSEISVMEKDIDLSIESGADGIVLGVLTSQDHVDISLLKRLVLRCGSIPVTFHRAFDVSAHLGDSMEAIIDSGCKRILTSGGAPGCEAGKEMIHHLAETARERIIIMPGGGITVDNISPIFHPLIMEYHMSARSMMPSPAKERIFETDFEETDAEKVRTVLSRSREFFAHS